SSAAIEPPASSSRAGIRRRIRPSGSSSFAARTPSERLHLVPILDLRPQAAMAQALIDLVKQQFPGAVLASHSQHGDETLVVKPDSWHAIHQFLRDDPRAAMNML